MVKKYYLLAIASYFSIPVVILLGAAVAIFIDPEIAARYPNYERNYRLLSMAKNLAFLLPLLVGMALWFLTCFFMVKSRERSCWWALLALLGPFGFFGVSMLADKAPAPRDFHQQFIGRRKLPLRVAYELGLFVAAWVGAYLCMLANRYLIILNEAARTGKSLAQAIDQQNASSGMWAFSEGMEVLYLVVTWYVVWPLCFNLLVRLPILRTFVTND